MKLFFILVGMILFIQKAYSAEANYYRFWQGYKKTGLSAENFTATLPTFVGETISFYQGKGLSNYLVAIPPKDKPSFIPDEFALVAFPNQKIYDDIRATPEGQTYADSHWNYFNKDQSHSAKMQVFNDEINFNTSYNILGSAIDLTHTSIYFFLGARKDGLSAEEFRKAVSDQVRNTAKNLKDKGLVGYLVLATENYEVAYLIFMSKQAAFASEYGKSVSAESSGFLDTLMFAPTENFNRSIEPGHFYSTLSGN